MRRARVYHQGRAQWARVTDDGAMLECAHGDRIAARDAHWLPPVGAGVTTFALGLNYADHSRELGFAAKQATPLIFLKGANAFVGHRGVTLRPADADQMHPECELVAVIGKPARRVREEDALAYVGGYTIANDYAIREYLENFYRPNARVKNRDATTPIGPWIVDAADVGDPQALALTTSINGELVQHGTTADMVMSVAGLIAWLSDGMTLFPGDLILTGTPHGVRFVAAGDEVVTEIGGIGRLTNTVKAG